MSVSHSVISVRESFSLPEGHFQIPNEIFSRFYFHTRQTIVLMFHIFPFSGRM